MDWQKCWCVLAWRLYKSAQDVSCNLCFFSWQQKHKATTSKTQRSSLLTMIYHKNINIVPHLLWPSCWRSCPGCCRWNVSGWWRRGTPPGCNGQTPGSPPPGCWEEGVEARSLEGPEDKIQSWSMETFTLCLRMLLGIGYKGRKVCFIYCKELDVTSEIQHFKGPNITLAAALTTSNHLTNMLKLGFFL